MPEFAAALHVYIRWAEYIMNLHSLALALALAKASHPAAPTTSL